MRADISDKEPSEYGICEDDEDDFPCGATHHSAQAFASLYLLTNITPIPKESKRDV
jgi:hypothetical protein